MTIFFHSSILPSGEFMRKRRKKGQVGDQKESLNPWKNIVIEINLHISPLSPLHMQNEWREEEEEEEENSNTPQRPLNPEQLCVLAPERRHFPFPLFPSFPVSCANLHLSVTYVWSILPQSLPLFLVAKVSIIFFDFFAGLIVWKWISTNPFSWDNG